MSSVSQTFVFIGLGNPGPQYARTRHNMGFLVIQALADKWGWALRQDRRFNALAVKGTVDSRTVHLLLPLTYMNLSGTSVRLYLDYYKVPHSHVVVVTDDIALKYGELRLRVTGSAGGHNGLKSIQAHLGTSQYMRLRMGVGDPGQQELAEYVLDPFTTEEQKTLTSFIDRGVEVLQRLLTESAAQVMNAVNTVPSKEPIDLTKPPLG